MHKLKYLTLILCLGWGLSLTAQINVISLSQDLILGFQMNQNVVDFERELAQLPFDTLASQLNTDTRKKTFWLNIYIAYSQRQMGEADHCDRKCKNAKSITVANRVFSLNDIMYKILLHSKGKVLPKRIFPADWEKALRVGYPDGRMLLVTEGDKEIMELNTYFEVSRLNDQLDKAAKKYLDKNAYYSSDKNVVFLPKWIKHFKREFGHEPGMIRGLKMAGVIPEDATVKIMFTDKMASLE